MGNCCWVLVVLRIVLVVVVFLVRCILRVMVINGWVRVGLVMYGLSLVRFLWLMLLVFLRSCYLRLVGMILCVVMFIRVWGWR